MGSAISTIQVFGGVPSGLVLAASGVFTSPAVDLARFNTEGFFSLQFNLTGSGTAKVEFIISNNDVDYIEPTGASDILSAFTSASGPGANGKDIFSFSPPLARFLKLRVTETGGANGVTVNGWLAIQ